MERYLIVGLGNFGDEYKLTKHNVGFLCIDSLCNKLNLKLDNQKFNGLFTSYKTNDKEVFFAKPLTYMNNSGHFVYEICNFYKIDYDNILVIYDDIDTEIGKIRIKPKGSSGGQNGIKNIIQLLKTENIKRIRIGIGKPNKDMVSYVLSKFSKPEKELVDIAIENASDAAIFYLSNDFEKTISKFNSK